MRTAQEWTKHELAKPEGVQPSLQLIQAIQADALRHAAELCRFRVDCEVDATAKGKVLYVANQLEAEADKLTK